MSNVLDVIRAKVEVDGQVLAIDVAWLDLGLEYRGGAWHPVDFETGEQIERSRWAAWCEENEGRIRRAVEAARCSRPSSIGMVEHFEAGTLHYHRCPECHEVHSCTAACAHEPDLDDGELLFGTFCTCDRCEAQP